MSIALSRLKWLMQQCLTHRDYERATLDPILYRTAGESFSEEVFRCIGFKCAPGVVVVLRHELPDSLGGIYLTRSCPGDVNDYYHLQGPDTGTVVAIGCDAGHIGLSPGDTVLFNQAHGKWLDGFNFCGTRIYGRVGIFGRSVRSDGFVRILDIGESIFARIIMENESPEHIRPLRDNILLLRDEVKMSHGGVLLSDASQHGQSTGIVVKVGSEVRHVKPGDRVVYVANAACKLRQLGYSDPGRYALFREAAILLIG